MKKFVIAIDGPAAAGKSSVAKALASKLQYDYIDTGAMYRCLTYAAIKQGIDVNNEEAIKELLYKTKIDLSKGEFFVDNENVSKEIRSLDVTKNVSVVCAYPTVRNAMADKQRELGQKGGVILDGRDIGTYVFPNAEIKFFQVANVEARAKRRYLENLEKGIDEPLEKTKEALILRDKLDSTRALAPLKQAEDAILIDTSDLTKEEVIEKMYNIVKEKIDSVNKEEL